MSKKKVIVAISSLLLIIISAIYIFKEIEYRAIKKGVDIYINAVMDKKFEVIYEYHMHSQKRIAVAMKSPQTTESHLKAIYEEQKALFEQAQPTQNLKEFWSEKYLFVRGMKYKIIGINMIEDVENPSLPIRERIDALVEIDMEYSDKETAPDFGGKLKKVTYLIKMVHSRNIMRTETLKSQNRMWLFKAISMKEGSLQY